MMTYDYDLRLEMSGFVDLGFLDVISVMITDSMYDVDVVEI